MTFEPWRSGSTLTRLIFSLLVALALAGCREPLYSQLNEQEANDVVAVLARAGIDAVKAPKGDKGWGVDIPASDMPQAVESLRAAGLPRQRYSNLGEMFKREGIVSTPTEERVRFMHGISQELSQTLSTIDGVTAARVHLVMPHNDPLADKAKVSSASVFIKHRVDVDPQPLLPAVKSLIVRSVEGLTFDTVHVSFFPAERPTLAQGAPLIGSAGIELPRRTSPVLAALLAATLFISLALGVYTMVRHRAALATDIRNWLPWRDALATKPQVANAAARADAGVGVAGAAAPRP